MEREQVSRFLANTHVADWNAKFTSDSHDHAAFRRAVQFCEHDTSNSRCLCEQPCLLQSILAGGGVHHQQGLMGRPDNNPLRGAPHLLQFRHQIGFGVQTAGGVDNDIVGFPCRGCLQRVEQYRRRVAASLRLDHFCSCALPPDLELLDGGGAECVRCAQQNCSSLGTEALSQLSDGGRLPGAVHTDHQNHFRGSVNLVRWNYVPCIQNGEQLIF